jgi:pimeloyl-ACP methyl ester carboxylesterase
MYDTAARTPEEIVESLERAAERFETPSGEGIMAWRAWGSGPPVVLLHGAHGGWTHWIRNIPALARRRRVIAADLPGYGESAPPHRIDSAWAVAETLAEGLRRLPLETPVDLVGFSLGAVMGAHLAAGSPELVRRLVIVAAGGLDTPLGKVEFERLSGLSDAERREAQRRNLLGLMLHAESAADELAVHLQMTKARRGALDAQSLVLPDKLARVLPEVRCQVDVIWGEFDRPHPDPELQAAVVRRTHPDAELRVAPGAGHWVMYENAPAFDAHLEALLDAPLRDPPPQGEVARSAGGG